MLNLNLTLIATFFLNFLSAVHITIEFFPEENIPIEYYVPNNGDLTLFKLEGWPEDSVISIFEEKSISKTRSPKNSLQSISKSVTPKMAIYSIGYTPGEKVKYIFKDQKMNLSEEVMIVPRPLYAKSLDDGAKVEAVLDQTSPAMYMINFTGFQKGEKVFMRSSSYSECIEKDITIDGEITMGYMPGVLGKKGGIAKLSYRRASGELLQLELPWGLEWAKYHLYMDKGKVKSLINDKEFLKKNPEVAEYFKFRKL